MALADKDRIFTNLYGFQPWNLMPRAHARRLGQHQGADRPGRDAIIQEMKDSGFAAVAVRASPPA
jgi:NADH-quinone oxidoreductase subunit F